MRIKVDTNRLSEDLAVHLEGETNFAFAYVPEKDMVVIQQGALEGQNGIDNSAPLMHKKTEKIAELFTVNQKQVAYHQQFGTDLKVTAMQVLKSSDKGGLLCSTNTNEKQQGLLADFDTTRTIFIKVDSIDTITTEYVAMKLPEIKKIMKNDKM